MISLWVKSAFTQIFFRPCSILCYMLDRNLSSLLPATTFPLLPEYSCSLLTFPSVTLLPAMKHSFYNTLSSLTHHLHVPTLTQTSLLKVHLIVSFGNSYRPMQIPNQKSNALTCRMKVRIMYASGIESREGRCLD